MEKKYIYEFIFGTNSQGVLENVVTRALSSFERTEIENKVKNRYSVIELPITDKKVFVNMDFVKCAVESEYEEPKIIAPTEEPSVAPQESNNDAA